MVRRHTRRTGEFDYRLTLPSGIEADEIDASLDDGVLSVRIAKAERAQPRRVEITGGADPLVAGRALIIVDFQNDFTPGGALLVPEGDQFASRVNELAASDEFDRVVATRDWHPPDHGSFTGQGGPWPPHCIAETPQIAHATGRRAVL